MKNKLIIDNKEESYVLYTNEGSYFREYLLNQLVLCCSISEAMIFEDKEIAKKFKEYLYTHCGLVTSINTYIDVV